MVIEGVKDVLKFWKTLFFYDIRANGSFDNEYCLERRVKVHLQTKYDKYCSSI